LPQFIGAAGHPVPKILGLEYDVLPVARFEQYRKDLSSDFHPDSVITKLKKLIKYHFSSFMDDPHFLRIYVRNLFLNKGFYHSEAFKAFRDYYRILEEVIEEGITKGIFRSEVNPRVFRNLLLGTFCHMVTRWFADRKMNEVEMIKEANQMVDLMAEAILAAKSQSGSGINV
jgi:TetR/AcrR family fatty acid metabolism transcriptional regulator